MTQAARRLTIRIPTPWPGARHERLVACWEAWAKQRPWIHLEWTRLLESHTASFQANLEAPCETTYLLLTEHDFLPSHQWTATQQLSDRAVLFPAYCTRDEGFMQTPSWAGGWFVLLNTSFRDIQKRLKIRPSGPYNDPGNDLPDQCRTLGLPSKMVLGLDSFPAVHYKGLGSHLFFSRHYNDPPEKPLVGLDKRYPQTMGAMLERHDYQVTEWERALKGVTND